MRNVNDERVDEPPAPRDLELSAPRDLSEQAPLADAPVTDASTDRPDVRDEAEALRRHLNELYRLTGQPAHRRLGVAAGSVTNILNEPWKRRADTIERFVDGCIDYADTKTRRRWRDTAPE